MILPIYVYGTGILREKARNVDVEKEEGLQQLIADMFETMKNADGVGLAAPQIGKSLRLVVVDGSDLADDMPELKDFRRTLINPEVVYRSEETAEYSEGCLSVPNVHADVTRPKEIRVKYLDEKYEEVEETFTGFGCRMVEHELDHLDGYMFVDRVSQIRKKMLQSRLNGIASGKVRTHYKVVKNR